MTPRVELPDLPGWSTVSRGDLHVVVRAGGAVVDRLGAAAEAGDVDDVLDALAVDGLRRTPDFVVVLASDAVRVVARGTAYAVLTVDGSAEPLEVRAPARVPWVDEDALQGVTVVELRTGDASDAAGGPVATPVTAEPNPAEPEPAAVVEPDPTEPEPEPVEAQPDPVGDPAPSPADQPVTAAADETTPPERDDASPGWPRPALFGRQSAPVTLPPAAAPVAESVAAAPPAPLPPKAPEPVAAEEPVALPVDQPVEEPDELPSYDHLFGATQHDRPSYIEQHDTGTIDESPVGHAPIESAGGFDPGAGAATGEGTLAPPAHTVAPPPSAPAAAAPPAASPSQAATSAEPPSPPQPGRIIDSVPWRSGGSNVPAPTVHPPRSAPAAPPPPPATAAPLTAPPVRPTASPVGPPPAIPARPAATPPTPPSAAAPRVPHAPPSGPPAAAPPTTQVPVAASSVTGPPPMATSAPTAPGASDDADATVDRSALLGRAGVEAGPTVLAVLCPAGHTSPPHSSACRQCGRDIPPQQPFQAPRPSLGVLRLPAGDVVVLDRGVLLGRSPRVNAELDAAARPHLVRVSSPQNDISRNHVEIVLEGWHVLIRDLGSTNGTTVALPGEAPIRLRPNDQQVLEPGTVITLADEVAITFEVQE